MARTFIRGLSVLFFVVAILATSLTGVHADDISDIPLESQCRPYVERALKELETGDSNPESVGDGKSNEDDKSIEDTTIESIDDSGEQNDAASAESSEPQQEASQENEPDANVSNEDVATSSEDSHEDQKSNEEEQKADNSSEQPAPESAEQSEENIENEQADQASAGEESVEEDVVAESIEDIEAVAETEQSEEDKASRETKEESGEVKEESGETKEESGETKEESGETKEESGEVKDESGEESVEEVAKSEEEGSQEQKSGETHEDDNDTKEVSVEHTEGGEDEESKQNESAEQTQENAVEDSSEPKEESVQSVEEAQSGEEKESGEEKDTVESTEDKTEEDITGDIERPATEEVSESVEQADEGAESSEPKAEDSNEDSQEGAEASEDASVENAEESEEADKKSVDDAASQEEDKSGDVESSESGGEEEAAQQSKEGSEEEKPVEEEGATVEGAAETQSQAESEEDSANEGEEAGSDSTEGEAAAEGDAVVEGEASGAPSTEEEASQEGATEETEESDATETKSSESEESHPEDDLLLEIEIPENLRERDHINELLHLDEEFAEKDLLLEKSSDIILRELKRSYDNAIKPLEILYKYRDLSNRHFGDPEIFSKPLVLFMGPWSGGKSSIINYLTDNEYTTHSLRTGAEPSPAYFNILMHGKEPEILDGTQLAADWTFSGLQKFGQGLEDRLRGLKLPNKLLEKVNIVEIPGILEVRKQVSRLFPFNDACQWFIDRADIIFLVYDPSKLDVGPETEAILDQLKGREYQTRIVLNKADQVKPEELMRVQGALIWNISPLMSSAQPPVMYTTSLWSIPYEVGSPARLLRAQERSLLRDLRGAIDKRIENKIASARRFAVRVRNHAKMVDCYLTTYYNHKSLFGNKKIISDSIIEHPQDYHIYEGLSTLTNISRYDLPDPETYRDFFRLNPLYDFQQLSATCTYFRGCPINKLDVAIAYDLPELVGKYKKMIEPINNQDSYRPS